MMNRHRLAALFVQATTLRGPNTRSLEQVFARALVTRITLVGERAARMAAKRRWNLITRPTTTKGEP